MEFEEKDYDAARNFASMIGGNAENIMTIFRQIDTTMDNLYGEDWSSCGADRAHERYLDIRANYDLFYQNVLKMQKHVNEVTERNEAGDAAASKVVMKA